MATSQTSEYKYVLMMLRCSFVVAGVFIDESQRRYERLYATLFTAFVVSGGLAIFVLFDRVAAVSEKTEVLYAVFGAIGVQVFLITFQLNKEGLREIYFRIEKMYETRKFGQISNRVCAKIISKYRKYVVYMVVAQLTMPLVIAAATDIPLGDLRTLIFPSWYPWSRTTGVTYALTIAAQVFTMFVAYMLLISIVAFFSAAGMAIYSDCEILLERLSGLETCQGNEWDREMKALIEQYRQLMNFSNKVIRMAANFINVLLCIVTEEVVVLISVFVQVEKDYFYKLKLLSACSVLTWAFFSYCVVGEILMNLKDRINYALYKTSWYCEDTKRRKVILIFMIINRNPLTLKALNMYPVNLRFSLSFARICYSVVQFLQNTIL